MRGHSLTMSMVTQLTEDMTRVPFYTDRKNKQQCKSRIMLWRLGCSVTIPTTLETDRESEELQGRGLEKGR